MVAEELEVSNAVHDAEQAVLEAARALTTPIANMPEVQTSSWQGESYRGLFQAIATLKQADREAAGEVE